LEAKPAHLAPHYGAQFESERVARAYRTRPPYPAELFDVLLKLQPATPRVVLDLGCGTGDVALGLAASVDFVDAVDPSEAMLRIGLAREGSDRANLCWTCASAENFAFRGPYSLVVASESLHWMDWAVVLPKIAAALRPGAFLTLAEGRSLSDVPWSADLAPLIARYSTNRDFRPYDLVTELTRRGLFREIGRHRTSPSSFAQSIDDYVESFHTRNGFSRERMTAKAASEFDELLRRAVLRHCADETVRGETRANLVWGIPS
jgi:SAM-dependent methyltransferase